MNIKGNLKIDIKEKIPDLVFLQSQYLSIILTNLIENAFKFSLNGSVVDVTLSCVRTSSTPGQFTFFVEILNQSWK